MTGIAFSGPPEADYKKKICLIFMKNQTNSAAFDDNLVFGDEVIFDDVFGDGLIRHQHKISPSHGPSCHVVLLVELEPCVTMIPVAQVAQVVHLNDTSAFAVLIFPHHKSNSSPRKGRHLLYISEFYTIFAPALLWWWNR